MTAPQFRLSRRAALRAAVGASALAALGGTLGACSSSGGNPVRVGYFPNLNHAPGLIADATGLFTKRIGADVATKSFNAGPDVIQAILSGSLDISYIGPNPTVTAYIQSGGQGIRVISGSTSGGASLVVKPTITSPAQLKGKKLATPQLGNTQDVALRFWLADHGLKTDKDGGGDVSILPQANSAAVQAFSSGSIDGGWLPEPFATRLVEAGGKVLVDERDLWPNRQFVVTNVIARTDFLQSNPAGVRAFIDAHLDALDAIAADAAGSRKTLAEQIKKITSQELKASVLEKSWSKLEFLANPLAATLRTSAEHADKIGLLPKKSSDNFAKLYDVNVLNTALSARGKPGVGTS